MDFQIIVIGVFSGRVPEADLLGRIPKVNSLHDSKESRTLKIFDVEKWYNFNFLFAESF